jgi:hypothetical protein
MGKTRGGDAGPQSPTASRSGEREPEVMTRIAPEPRRLRGLGNREAAFL